MNKDASDIELNSIQRKVVELVNILSPKSVLDLGCGSGAVLLNLTAHRRVGLDIRTDISKHLAREGIEFNEHDLTQELPFESCSFSCVICTDTLEHLLDPSITISEAYRVLELGGYFIVSVPNLCYWKNRLLILFGKVPGDMKRSFHEHISYFSFLRLRKLLEEQKFHVESEQRVGRIAGRIPQFVYPKTLSAVCLLVARRAR